MAFMKGSIEREKDAISKMINLYCRDKHNLKQSMCKDCQELLDYSWKRLDMCKYGYKKPTCERCTVHCYTSDMRERVKKVMRYAGPRMIIVHPLEAIRHLIRSKTR